MCQYTATSVLGEVTGVPDLKLLTRESRKNIFFSLVFCYSLNLVKSHDIGDSLKPFVITRERAVQAHNTLSQPGLQGPSQQSYQHQHCCVPGCDSVHSHSLGYCGF